MRTAAAVTYLLLAACGEGATELTATARVEGSFVLVEASCPGATDVELQPFGLHDHCSLDNPAQFRLAAAQLGAGTKKLTVTGTMVNHKPTALEVAVEVPEAALAPYFLVDSCADDTSSTLSMTLRINDKEAVTCKAFGGARAKLVGRASPGGRLVVGGKAIEVPPSGEIAAIVDLSEGILALTIDELVERDGKPKLVLPWKLEAKGKSVEGKLAFTAAYSDHRQIVGRWLRDVADGKIDRPAFVARPGRKTVVRVPSGTYDAIVASDRRGTVRELALIAIERETKRTKDGVCEFDSNGRVTRATRYGVELELKVTNTLDGNVVATRTFASTGGCPSFAMLDPTKPEVAVSVGVEILTAWLDELST